MPRQSIEIDGDMGSEIDLDDISASGSLGALAIGDTPDIVGASDHTFGHQKTGCQLEVASRRAHGDGQAICHRLSVDLADDTDLQGFLGRDPILASIDSQILVGDYLQRNRRRGRRHPVKPVPHRSASARRQSSSWARRRSLG